MFVQMEIDDGTSSSSLSRFAPVKSVLRNGGHDTEAQFNAKWTRASLTSGRMSCTRGFTKADEARVTSCCLEAFLPRFFSVPDCVGWGERGRFLYQIPLTSILRFPFNRLPADGVIQFEIVSALD